MEWTYGILKSRIESTNLKDIWKRNPIYLDNIVIYKNKALEFKIEGQGKIIQISFTSNSRDATIAYQIDKQEVAIVNNGHCLMKLCDTRGIGYFQIQEIEKDKIWRYTCLIPVIFDKKMSVVIGNEAHNDKNIKVNNVHIYYLIPKEVIIHGTN